MSRNLGFGRDEAINFMNNEGGIPPLIFYLISQWFFFFFICLITTSVFIYPLELMSGVNLVYYVFALFHCIYHLFVNSILI